MTVQNKVATHVGHQVPLLSMVKQGNDPARQLGGWPMSQWSKKNWLTSVKDWTGRPVQDLLTIAQNRQEWQALSIHVLPHP